MKGPCRHCGRVRSLLARRLCWRCYRAPHVRGMYGRVQPHGNGYDAADNATPPPPQEPTATPPGSPERVAVLQARVAAGRGLWHAGDVRRDLS